MSAKQHETPDADQLYARLLADMTDVIDSHNKVATNIAQSAVATLSSFIDPESKDAVEKIALKLTQRLTDLTFKMTTARDDLKSRVRDALDEIDRKRAILIQDAKTSGGSTDDVRRAAYDARTTVFSKSVALLTDMVQGYQRESISAQQDSAKAFTELVSHVGSSAPAELLERLDALDTKVANLPKLLRAVEDRYEDPDADWDTRIRPSQAAGVKKASNQLVPVSSHVPDVGATDDDVENMPLAVSQAARKPSKVVQDYDDPYDGLIDRDMDRRKIRALETIADAWRKFDKDGSVSKTLDYAMLGALLTSLLGGLLPDIMTRFPAMKLAADVLKYFREGKLLSSIKDLIDARWTKLADWSTDMNSRTLKVLDWFHDLAAPVLTALKDSPIIKKALGLADTLSDLKTSAMSKLPQAVSSVVGKLASGVEAVRGSSIVKSVGNAVSTARTMASGAAGLVGKFAGATGSTLMRAAQGMANSPIGTFVMKNLGRLGNLAMVLDVITGTLEEATGKKVDSVSVLDAVLNPMKLGRFLGNKGNQLFEKKMGQSVGSWVYDVLNGDEEVAKVAPMYGKPKSSVVPSTSPAASTSPVRQDPPTSMGRAPVQQTQQTPAPSPRSAQFSGDRKTMSNSPGLSPSSIPNFMSVDPNTGAMLFGALHR